MNTARRRRRLFPLRPRPLLPPQPPPLPSSSSSSCSSPPPFPRHPPAITSSAPPPPHHCAAAASLGELGDAMMSMLPKGLPFTVFAPSADAFRRVLNLRPNGSAAHAAGKQTADNDDTDTYAVLSRVLGFSAVPQRLLAGDVAPRSGGSARVLDSVSGLRIHVARDDARGAAALVANGVRSECVDIVRGETVVHVMDAEFERSFAVGFDS